MIYLNRNLLRVLGKCDVGSTRWKIFSFLWMTRQHIKGKLDVNTLKTNLDLKDIHYGKRCFILGNGPSINNIHLGDLKDEYVMTVNNMMIHPRFRDLRSNYHFIMDLYAFGMGENDIGEGDDMLENLRILEDFQDIRLFVPLVAKSYLEEKEISSHLNISYINTIDVNYKEIKDVQLTKLSPFFHTVVQQAITVAIYMGFKEIYLLGCEATTILSIIDVALGKRMSSFHCYDEKNEIQENGIKKSLQTQGIRKALLDTVRVLEDYEKLSLFSKRQGVSLINLSEKTLIDSIRRDTIDNVLASIT